MDPDSAAVVADLIRRAILAGPRLTRELQVTR
jgi:hypothetical protein